MAAVGESALGDSVQGLRPPLLGQGLACLLIAAALYGLGLLGEWPLVACVVVLQVLLLLGFLALVDAPASGGVFVVGLLAALASDAVVVLDAGSIDSLPGVLGVAFLVGLAHQLGRRDRQRVLESLAGTLVAVSLVAMLACLVAARQHESGPWVSRAGLAAAGFALLAGRLGDLVVQRPALAVGASRAWPGLILALGAGVAGAALVADGHLSARQAALVGLVAAAAAAAADLALDLAASDLTTHPDDARRVAALRPVAVLLPFAALGPVVLLVTRLVAEAGS